jgi:hypothetical protein
MNKMIERRLVQMCNAGIAMVRTGESLSEASQRTKGALMQNCKTVEEVREWALTHHPTVSSLKEGESTLMCSEFGLQWFGPEDGAVTVARFFFRHAQDTPELRRALREGVWPNVLKFGEIEMCFESEREDGSATYRRKRD